METTLSTPRDIAVIADSTVIIPQRTSAETANLLSSPSVAEKADEISQEEGKENSENSEDPEFNSLAFTRCFFSDETSFTLKVGGEEQLYTRKKFQHGPHRCFLDLEALSKMPKLFNYYLLSAVATDHKKEAYYAKCYVEHKVFKKRYLLLAILRAKCLSVRYEFVLCDEEDDNAVFILCGISKIDPYIFLPDVKVDFEAAEEILASYLCNPKNRLALIEGHADKDEYGSLVAPNSIDPIGEGISGAGGSNKRRSKQTKRFGVECDLPADKKRKKNQSKVPKKKVRADVL